MVNVNAPRKVKLVNVGPLHPDVVPCSSSAEAFIEAFLLDRIVQEFKTFHENCIYQQCSGGSHVEVV